MLLTLRNLLTPSQQVLKSDRRQSVLPMSKLSENLESSFEALPSLADELKAADDIPSNEELENLKTEVAELKTKVQSIC